MYADDLVLTAPSSMGSSMLLSMCSKRGIEHDIKYNSAKSNLMIFLVKFTHPNFVLNGEILPRVSKCKCLGHIITKDLSDNDDMSRQYKISCAQGNALIRK